MCSVVNKDEYSGEFWGYRGHYKGDERLGYEEC